MEKKRGKRRHHEERVKAKWRKRLRIREEIGFYNTTWKWRIVDGKRKWTRVLVKDPHGKREAYIERATVRRAHHNKCPCKICKRERYVRERYIYSDEDLG